MIVGWKGHLAAPSSQRNPEAAEQVTVIGTRGPVGMAAVRKIVNAYREKYLSSEHWFGLKTRAMQHYGCRCAICGKADIANDVHHVKYKNLRDVEIHDLRVLCREHHELVHATLDRHPRIFDRYRDCDSSVLWGLTLKEAGLQPTYLLPEPPARIGRYRNPYVWVKGRVGYQKRFLSPARMDASSRCYEWGDNAHPGSTFKPKDNRNPFREFNFALVVQR